VERLKTQIARCFAKHAIEKKAEDKKMLNIFDKNSITETDIEYEWFKNKLDTNFSIPDDNKSKVIFGFNGIGKSTIFKCISKTSNDKIAYLEYGDLKTQLIKGKDTIVISPNINLIAQLNSQIEPLKPSLNAQKNLKDTFGFKKADEVKLFGQKIQTAWKNKSFSGFVKTKTDIEAIEKSLSGIPPKVFIGAITEISAVQNAQQELQDEKDNALFHILNSLDKIIDQTDSVCPVCGNDVPHLKQTIQAKMNALSNKQSALIEKLKQENITTDENLINNLVNIYGKINADANLMADYLLCSGNSSTYDTLKQNLITVQGIETQLQPLVAQAKSSYTNIKNAQSALESDLKRYFQVTESNVNYNDSTFTVTIKFPREIKTYSTGELNLLSFLYKIYSFIGSDKSVLLLDDPVSSLDLVNHYKIAYEIVKTSIRKTLIVLTHSTEFVNVVNSKYKRFHSIILQQILISLF
jgi:ATPase subunit of ABC transporter with duplicated ATPase domains